jgi:cytoskeletal protein CcmA (bactofilin family)
LIIGPEGVVHATVQSATVIVHGEIVGRVSASERVELKPTARVFGDIEAPVIVMEAGAMHEGQCRMSKGERDGEPRGVVVPFTG